MNPKSVKVTENKRRTVLKLLPVACGMPDARTFADEVLEIKPNFWAMIVNGDKLPSARADLLETYFRKHFLSFQFDRRHLEFLPQDFVDLFKREKVYPELLRAIKAPAPPPKPPRNPLKRFYGYFCGLYICSDQKDKRKPAVAFDVFEIFPSEEGAMDARIAQITNPFSPDPAFGSVRVKRDTVEIQINFENGEDPDAIYMAPAPRTDEINTLLAISVDLQHPLRLVTARPTLFVRIRRRVDVPKESAVYAEKSRLYSAIKPVFEKLFVNKPKRFQVETKPEIDEVDEDAIEKALLQTLREEAAEPLPPDE
jgi:hypothetical protein